VRRPAILLEAAQISLNIQPGSRPRIRIRENENVRFAAVGTLAGEAIAGKNP